MDSILHITNGDSFTDRLKGINPPGEIYTWREILCEGPTLKEVFSDEFVSLRQSFLTLYSSDDSDDTAYETMAYNFKTLSFNSYNQLVLWFEYDLFCHLNLAAAVHFFRNQHKPMQLFLVCSGKVDGQDGYFGLGELTTEQLLFEAENRLQLDDKAIDALCLFWECYSDENHNEMKAIEFDASKLPYLKYCIQAHLERFPKKETGINALEERVLLAIVENEFISEKQLLGYMLRNQGYYGFGDLQWERIIRRLKPLFSEVLHLVLNDKGEGVLNRTYNAYALLKDNTQFGGVLKYDYFYNSKTQELTPAHAN